MSVTYTLEYLQYPVNTTYNNRLETNFKDCANTGYETETIFKKLKLGYQKLNGKNIKKNTQKVNKEVGKKRANIKYINKT